MQKKIYIGGLPWELDRIGLLNYFKAILEGNDMSASYELPFIASPLVNPNATLRVVDVFVALDRQTNKSRGFGFITLDIIAENGEELFNKVVELLNKRVLIGIRGPRELIVKEADPRNENGNGGGNGGRENNETEEAQPDNVNIEW
jgi:RNA recognition motif-containing protein